MWDYEIISRKKAIQRLWTEEEFEILLDMMGSDFWEERNWEMYTVG